MARREEAGIGIAGEGGGLGLAVDDRHLMTITAEFIGRGDADNSGSENEGLHVPPHFDLVMPQC